LGFYEGGYTIDPEAPDEQADCACAPSRDNLKEIATAPWFTDIINRFEKNDTMLDLYPYVRFSLYGQTEQLKSQRENLLTQHHSPQKLALNPIPMAFFMSM